MSKVFSQSRSAISQRARSVLKGFIPGSDFVLPVTDSSIFENKGLMWKEQPAPEPLAAPVTEEKKPRGRPKGSTKKKEVVQMPLLNQLIHMIDGRPDLIQHNVVKKRMQDCSYAVIYTCSCGIQYAVVTNKTPSQHLTGMRYQLKHKKGRNEFFDHLDFNPSHYIKDDYYVHEEYKEKLSMAVAHQRQRELAFKYRCINEPSTTVQPEEHVTDPDSPPEPKSSYSSDCEEDPKDLGLN